MPNGHDVRDEWERRTRQVVQRATSDTVTEDLLCGRGRFSNNFYLSDRPLVAHLDDSELPHFGFYNERKGIGVDSKRNNRTPDAGGITAVLLTDRRVLAVIGKDDGDERLTIPYDVVTAAEYHTGIMKNRLEVETHDTTYHVWIDSEYQESTLEEAVAMVEQKRSGGEPSTTGSTPGTTASSDGGAAGDPFEEPVSDAEERSSTNGAGVSTAPDGDSGEDADPLDKLERLQELHESGVLTDEEFQEKKSDLLDQI